VTDSILHLSIPVDDLAAAREFYEKSLGCRVPRTREDWLDVWFFGMQLTLQHRPDEVAPVADQGVRHFGVTLPDAETYRDLVERLRSHRVRWLSEPKTDVDRDGKTGGKLADPSGNIIEIKFYEDPSEFEKGMD
jgi:extradiol dioxygenase family protein